MKKEELVLRIKGISLDKYAAHPRILLQNQNEGITVPLEIDPYEANSIILEMEKIHPSRSSVYDFIVDVFDKQGISANSVLLHSFTGKSCRAVFRYRRLFRNRSIDIKPSDAVALAVRLGIPITVPREETPTLKYLWYSPAADPETERDFLFLGQQKPQCPFL